MRTRETGRRVKATSLALVLTVLSTACGGGGSGPPPPPPPPPVTVTVAPATQNVLLGATQAFTATVTNATNTSVTWSVNGITGGNFTVGTIDVNGLYRGPAILPSPAAVTIRATSVASPSSSGTATVTVTSDVVVSVSANPAPPVAGKVDIGFTQQFTQTITSAGAPDPNVSWSIGGAACGGAGNPCGTINTATGLYSAPRILPNPNSVTVTATSVADPSKSGSTTVSIDPRFSFAVSGPSSINNGTTAQFSATATPLPGTNANPSQSVNWLAPSGPPGGCTGPGTGLDQCGTIDATGLYTAPLIAPANPTVFINGQSVADPSKAQSPSATIIAIIVVTVSPATLSIEIEGPQQFTATVGGVQNQNVTWSISGPGCALPNTPCGQLSVSPGQVVNGSVPVIYTAPISIPSGGIGPVTITATSVADITKSASTTPTFFSTISASLQPSGSTRAVNHRVTLFGGLLRTSTGTAPVANAVDWTVIDSQGNRIPGGNSTVGEICTVALIGCTRPGATAAGNPQGDVDYVTPASVPPGQTVLIEMRSQADPSKSAMAQVSVIPSVQISVLPTTTTLPPGQTQPFTVNVVGAANKSVTWDVNGVVSGNASLGQICVAGSNPCSTPSVPTPPNQSVEYRAPSSVPTPNPVTVTATSADDPTKFASGTVTISTGPFISKILPTSITALDAQTGTAFALKVQGINFVPSSPGPGSVIIFSGTRFDGQSGRPSTNCSNNTIECTAQVRVSDVSIPSNGLVIQIENPGNPPAASNSPFLVVLDPATQQKDFDHAAVITLSAGPQPVCQAVSDAGCQNITVVEPTTMGSTGAAGQVNLNLIGVFSGSSCLASGLPIAVVRPTSLTSSVSICVVGTANFSATDKFTISGPNPTDITVLVDPNQNFPSVSVKLSLAIPFNAKTGPRTLFVETANHEKSAFVGAIEVK